MSLVRLRSEAPVKETQPGFQYAAVAHLVERHLAKVEVASSSLVGRSIKEQQQLLRYGPVAQLVEQRTENPRVAGSIPALGTICGLSSSGRAPPCQGGGSEFEPRSPLQSKSGHQIWMP